MTRLTEVLIAGASFFVPSVPPALSPAPAPSATSCADETAVPRGSRAPVYLGSGAS